MSRFSRVVLPVLLLAVGVVSCDAPNTFAPKKGVEIVVDSAVYHLVPLSGGITYRITMNVTVINGTDQDVFLSQDCGHWHLGRVNNDGANLELGAYACIEGERQQPLLIAARDQYTKVYPMYGSNSPQTRPPLTIADNTGTLIFSYGFTSPQGDKSFQLQSAPFEVVPPQ